MFETNPLKLDEWDVRFIHLAKNGGRDHPITKYRELWGERCDVDPTIKEIPKYMFSHYLELFLRIHADDEFRRNYALMEIFKQCEPNTMLCDPSLSYWEQLLVSLAGKFAITLVAKLPFYREKVLELGLHYPFDN